MTKPAPLFNRLALIGVGLIGSSIARAARTQGAVREIAASARSAATRRRIAELGLADQVLETNAAAVDGADLVIVCAPVGACGEIAKEIAPHLKAGAVVSDVGSVKGAIVRDMGPHLPANVHFVRRIRLRAPSIRARTPVLPNCSSAAGAFSPRPKAQTPPPSSGSPHSGARSVPMSKQCRPRITISFWRSPAICRI